MNVVEIQELISFLPYKGVYNAFVVAIFIFQRIFPRIVMARGVDATHMEVIRSPTLDSNVPFPCL